MTSPESRDLMRSRVVAAIQFRLSLRYCTVSLNSRKCASPDHGMSFFANFLTIVVGAMSSLNLTGAAEPEEYKPSVQDVLDVKTIIVEASQLPPEMIDIIIDYAEYWPHTSVTTTQSSLATGSRLHENVFIVSLFPSSKANANIALRSAHIHLDMPPPPPLPSAGTSLKATWPSFHLHNPQSTTTQKP
jgi:hypothetical protein